MYERGHCWACSIWPPRNGHHRLDLQKRMEVYELMVEWIEDNPRKWVSISDLARTQGGNGPLVWGTALHVVRDMHAHGLLMCVVSDRAGRCLRWVRSDQPWLQNSA